MAFPICDKCASSGILCEKCEWKVREDEISELDVLVSTILRGHDASGYEKLVGLDKKLVIFASDDEAPKIIGPRGAFAKELSRKLGRRVVVLSKGMDMETIANSLARPARLVGHNRIYKEGDKEQQKLIFDKVLDEGTIDLMRELLGDIEIEYSK
jgi:hypothetical protein